MSPLSRRAQLARAGCPTCAWRPCPAAGGGILRARGPFLPAGGISRIGGPESSPRRRRMPPPGADRARPRGMSPAAQRRMEPGGGPTTRERDVGCLGAVGAGLCIGKRWRAVAETAPTAGPMSKSDTKNFAGVKRAKRNRMISRFCCSPEEREASFVSDLDTTRSASQDLSGDAGGEGPSRARSTCPRLCSPASAPARAETTTARQVVASVAAHTSPNVGHGNPTKMLASGLCMASVTRTAVDRVTNRPRTAAAATTAVHAQEPAWRRRSDRSRRIIGSLRHRGRTGQRRRRQQGHPRGGRRRGGRRP